jgi:3-oxoacyl-[acyl-carrier protein] reductase
MRLGSRFWAVLVGAETEMNDFDFTGKTVLVIGGSSGIGNAIAQSFRGRNADMFMSGGTRRQASDYKALEGCNLAGLHTQVDVGDFSAIAALKPAFDRLDVLVLSQGIVL